MKRRDFLGLGLAAAMQAGCRSSSESVARPWGTPEPGQEIGLLDAQRRPGGILEIFCLGGFSPWETFYAVPGRNQPGSGEYAGQQWWTWQGSSGGLSVPEYMDRCGSDRPLLEPWVQDSRGAQLHLGPFAGPLRARKDIVERLRVWTMAHSVEPHEAAIPLGICGQAIGNPRMASLGAHIERFERERGSLLRTAPYSYAIAMRALDVSHNGTAAWAIGRHGSLARPMTIHLGQELRLTRQLAREDLAGWRTELDAVSAHYAERFGARLVPPTRDARVRSRGFGEFDFARVAMTNHETLARLLPEALLRSSQIIPCSLGGGEGSSPRLDQTTTAIRIAAQLLTDPESPARYVQVLDDGLFVGSAGQGYDSHENHVQTQGPNLQHMLKALTAVINEPGENDPRKLNLDDHFVLLNTEFGRAPYPEVTLRRPNGTGSNHWPWGYVVAGFGAFADREHSGIVGALGEDGRAIDSLTPSEHRAAMLLAMGIWPFTPESFAVGDVRGARNEIEAALMLKERVLGYRS